MSNPYQTPATPTPQQIARPNAGGGESRSRSPARAIFSWCLILYQLGAMAFITLVGFIAVSGTWVNWPNALRLFGGLVLGLLLSQLIFWVWRTSRRMEVYRTALTYAAGIAGGALIFALDRWLYLFGGFTY